MSPARRCLILTMLLFLAIRGQAQEDPVDHMNFFAQLDQGVSSNYMSYISELAHGQRARKQEKRRTEVVTSIRDAIRAGSVHRPYEGDASLRDAFVNYWKISLSVFNEDYGKVVDLEEIAEQSYDAMEAYILARQKADERLDLAHAAIPPVYEAFANAHHIIIKEGSSQSELSRKLEQTGRVSKYVDRLYLIYFKSSKQEAYMMNALNKSDINSLEQNRVTLVNFTTEGLQQLDSIPSFEGDGSLVEACRKVLLFLKDEAENKIPIQGDFLMKKEAFERYKSSFEAIPQNKRTQKDVDTYNNQLADLNKLVNTFNSTSQSLNTSRTAVMTNWTNTFNKFNDRHVPRY